MAERTVARRREVSATQGRSGSGTAKKRDTGSNELASMKVDDLRRLAREHGATGTSAMRKEELIKAVSKALTKTGRGDAKKTAAAKSTAAKSTATRSTASKSAASKSAASKSAASKSAASKSAASKSAASRSAASRSAAKNADTKKSAARTTRGARRGSDTSKSVTYAQEITSPDQAPERAGRTLVTTDHDVIRQWAEERDAVPASVQGSEHEGHLGVLRFDFPGGDSEGRLIQVSWEEWFETFDARGLNFIYQEERVDGRQSNFFRLENPRREDG